MIDGEVLPRNQARETGERIVNREGRGLGEGLGTCEAAYSTEE